MNEEIRKEGAGTPAPYWFAAKRYGWGWGWPLTWQGYVVLGLYAIVVGVLALLLPPDLHPVGFAAGTAAASAVLLLVCWRKGEPPRWRWGGD